MLRGKQKAGYFGFFSRYSDLREVGIGTVVINFLMQKIFLINKGFPHMTHYTSRVVCSYGLTIEGGSKETLKCFASSTCCYINAGEGVSIGRKVIFASGVKIISGNHDLMDRNKHVVSMPIIIHDNVWIGANSVILPGVVIGINSVIGAGSIVTKSVPDNVICAGNPAKVIKILPEI
jgi:acetyltransferase-like isoleucine patch superfamily enzyme